MARLTLSGLTKSFGGLDVVKAVDLEVTDGELVCLLGPSGSGKSTILRMIGGFEVPSGGAIRIDGEDVTAVPPERRPTGMVFQSHALWSHMDVFANIAFGLKLRRLPRAEIRSKVEAVLELVGLAGYGSRRVWQLSGGQQQRVAIARSLVLEPKILLLDEPFASLDQHLRERLREEVRDIQQRLGITTLFVTHGQDEALALADRIVVLKDGAIEQTDRPSALYRRPATRFVAGFIGHMNLVPTEFRAGRSTRPEFALAAEVSDGPAEIAFRPEATGVRPAQGSGNAVVYRVTDFGTHLTLDLDLEDGTRIKAHGSGSIAWTPGQRVEVTPAEVLLYRDGVLLSTETRAAAAAA
ncbi:ABC transporter ATP-binding protein [Pannonibacter sp. SL95]|uniref:ABC transporter ATP-binding protein n=1 Tax=Pannonibacter sp. SL95 TaxID=2995153 RepID=UPI002274245B|nr:ABC transporter ATP-binding protein [Pannonibacter sp. SL95]MCY1705058.1 ABC transporter ATP-binding protein [Pannonibacter sp. SL95]